MCWIRLFPVQRAESGEGRKHHGDGMKNWFFLFIAIIAEVIATSALKMSDGFTKLWPVMVVALGYGLAFYFLSLTLRTIPIGIAYAVWSGVGIVLISFIGWLVFGQKLDLFAVIGITLIISGVLVLNVFSKSVAH
jgi:small multidrug resistance pump